MASEILDPIAEALVTELQGCGFDLAHKWAPRAADLGTLPAAVVELPTVKRTEPDEREDQLGSITWRLTFPVMAYVQFDDPEYGQRLAVELVEAFIVAIDNNPTLGLAAPVVHETKVVDTGPPVIFESETPPMIRYPMRVSVLAYVQ